MKPINLNNTPSEENDEEEEEGGSIILFDNNKYCSFLLFLFDADDCCLCKIKQWSNLSPDKSNVF